MILDTFTSTVEETDPLAGAPTIESLRSRFNSYDGATDQARSEAFRDRGYYDGDKQIGTLWKEHLSKFNLPPIYINKVRKIVDGHIGIMLGQQTDPEAFPRSEKDINAAAVATKLLRYVTDKSKYKQKKADAMAEMFIEGIGAVLVQCTANEVMIDQISFREFIYDPFSRQPDFSDASWLGFVKWANVDDVIQTWPEAYKRMGQPASADYLTVGGVGFKDSPDTWVDKKARRLQVITMYFKEGGRWKYVVWCHAGILDFDDSPYTDSDDRSLCPLIPMSCYVNGDPDGHNERYGIVRDLIKPQDEYNAHRAQALQHATSRKVQQVDADAEVVDIELVRKEAARPDAVLPPGWNYLPDNGLAEQINLMQLADQELQRNGPTPAVLGRNLGASESGRSRQVQAAAGLTEIAIILDRADRFDDAVMRMVWNQVRQYWGEEMEIRVTGDARSPEFIKVNVPKLGMVPQPVAGPDGQPVLDALGQPMIQMVQGVVGYDNHVAEMDMDIVVAAVPESVNLEHEVFGQLMQFMASTGITPNDPNFMIMLELSPLTNKRDTIEKIEALKKRAAEEGAAAAEQQQKMQAIGLQLETEDKQSQIAKNKATAQKTMVEAESTAIANEITQAETINRSRLMDYITQGMNPNAMF